MRSKLSTSNPYMHDRAQRDAMVFRSVASSSAIEGIRAPFRQKARPARPPVAGEKKRVKNTKPTAA
ncbi:MAG: hypothetical protein Q9M29_06450 [Mariprofundaceae bacterium]|nr:hypothetical protein [Mariprofundaceae bacterium]